MSDQQRGTTPADGVFFNQDEDGELLYRQPASPQPNGRVFTSQQVIPASQPMFRDEQSQRDPNPTPDYSDPYYDVFFNQDDPYVSYATPSQSAPQANSPVSDQEPFCYAGGPDCRNLDHCHLNPVPPSVEPEAPSTPAPAPATPNQAQPPASPTPDANQAEADDKDDKKGRKNKGKVRRAALKPLKAVGRKLRRHDGLVRQSHCKTAKFYWLVIWGVIPAIMYFLARAVLDFMETPTGIAAHNPVAAYYSHQQAMHHVSSWGPAIVIAAVIIAIVLMVLVRSWDLRQHFGSATKPDGNGANVPVLAMRNSAAIDHNKVASKQKKRRNQFRTLLILVAIPVALHFIGQL